MKVLIYQLSRRSEDGGDYPEYSSYVEEVDSIDEIERRLNRMLVLGDIEFWALEADDYESMCSNMLTDDLIDEIIEECEANFVS